MSQTSRPLALVTGASSGIGYELAKCCAENGFDLVVAADQPEIDGNKIGIWGISLGGGHVLHVAAFDKRLKAAVAVVPLGLDYDSLVPLMGPEGMAGFMGVLTGDRIGRAHGRPNGYIALVSDGLKHPVHYSIGEDTGIIDATRGVEWCVVGLDRNWAYAPACKMALP